jgi:hypothetical protein
LKSDDPFDDPLWQQAGLAAATRGKPDQRFIGCPLWWFMQVFPIVRGKNELACALAVYRLRIIQRTRIVSVSNVYLAKLGIDRYAKYRTLSRLADAGLVVIRRHNKRAYEIEFRSKRGNNATWQPHFSSRNHAANDPCEIHSMRGAKAAKR